MPTVEVKDINNKVVGKAEHPFELKDCDGVLFEAVIGALANKRQGTHSTKGRSDVRGGGRKPYRQKKTGRARAGTIRSPLWRGGGIVFGPHPRDYSYSIPRKAKRRALAAALSMKLKDGEITVVDAIDIKEPRTKEMVSILKNMGLEGKRVLVVLNEHNAVVAVSARNIPAVEVIEARELNACDVTINANLLMTKDALKALEERTSV